MAKAILTRVECVSLTLSKEECEFLTRLLGRHISGDEGGWRGVSDNICTALLETGWGSYYELPDASYAGSRQVVRLSGKRS